MNKFETLYTSFLHFFLRDLRFYIGPDFAHPVTRIFVSIAERNENEI